MHSCGHSDAETGERMSFLSMFSAYISIWSYIYDMVLCAMMCLPDGCDRYSDMAVGAYLEQT